MRRLPLLALLLSAIMLASGAGLSVSPVHASHALKAHKTINAAEGGSSYVFKPAKVTIKVGTKVTWKNPTDAPHTVTSMTSSWKFDKSLDEGKTVSFTFKKAGTYKYHCTFHEGMVGTIKVVK